MGRGPALRLLPYGPSLVGQSASSELPEPPGTLPILGCLDFPPLSPGGGVGQFPEASRNLDVEHEHQIQEALIQLQGAMTIAVIAHGLSSLRRPERLAVPGSVALIG